MPNKNKIVLASLLSLTLATVAHADQHKHSPFAILRTAQASVPAMTQTYRYPDGTEYTGEWKNGLPEGDGKLKLPDGSRFIGAFHLGVPEGTGILQQSDGTLYQGEWRAGTLEGLGVMEYVNGNRYEGEWHNDRREGAGTLLFPSGTRFVGQWKNDLRQGRGELRQKTGETYVGDYANDVPHGYGTSVESDRTIYAGTFSRGKRHGVGDCTDSAGHTETCVYNKGVRVASAAALSRANSFKARFEPQFSFTDGVALLWENNFTKGKGLVSEKHIVFTKRAALLGSELKLEARGQNFFMLVVVNDYKGAGRYRLSGEDIVVSLEGDLPLFLAGSDAGEINITADKETTVEGELVVPKLFAHGKAGQESIAIRRGQFRALPSDFETLKKAAISHPATTHNLNIKKSNRSTLRSHKPLVNGTQPADLEELIQQVNQKGKQQRSEDAVEPHGKR